MEGNWVAECTLCPWQQRYVEQDDALKAATTHSIKVHTDEHSVLASGKWITHVQQRAVDAVGTERRALPEVVQTEPIVTQPEPVVEPQAQPDVKPEGN